MGKKTLQLEGEEVTKAALNVLFAEISSKLNSLTGSNPATSMDAGVILTTSTAQNVNPSSWYQINFDMVVDDPTGMADTANNRIIINTEGVYLITATIHWGAAPTGTKGILVSKNGVYSAATGTVLAKSGGYPQDGSIAFFARLNSGDHLTLSGYQNSGSAVNLLTTPCGSLFAAQWIRP